MCMSAALYANTANKPPRLVWVTQENIAPNIKPKPRPCFNLMHSKVNLLCRILNGINDSESRFFRQVREGKNALSASFRYKTHKSSFEKKNEQKINKNAKSLFVKMRGFREEAGCHLPLNLSNNTAGSNLVNLKLNTWRRVLGSKHYLLGQKWANEGQRLCI